MSVETEWDNDGFAAPGTYPISVAHLAGNGVGGKPFATVTSAACAFCEKWASELAVGSQAETSDAGDKVLDVRIQRHRTLIIYTCPDHVENAFAELLNNDEFGGGTNMYDPNELAAKVTEAVRARFRS